MIRAFLGAAALAVVGQMAPAACDGPPVPCEAGGGNYHIELPDNVAGSPPAVIFLHGYGGSGAGTMKMRGMVEAIKARGYAVIAPTAERRGGDGPRSWAFYPGRGGRDERAFLDAVRNDAAGRFGIDPAQVILAGFSGGAFMVNYLACDTPGAFAAYAPVSGGFWNPLPESCKGPVRLFHTHGWSDRTVPLEGRALHGGGFVQGDVFAGLEIWRRANACADHKPSGFSTTGEFMRRKWTRCAPGAALEFALFPGGHGVPKGWAGMMIDWFENLPGSS